MTANRIYFLNELKYILFEGTWMYKLIVTVHHKKEDVYIHLNVVVYKLKCKGTLTFLLNICVSTIQDKYAENCYELTKFVLQAYQGN